MEALSVVIQLSYRLGYSERGFDRDQIGSLAGAPRADATSWGPPPLRWPPASLRTPGSLNSHQEPPTYQV